MVPQSTGRNAGHVGREKMRVLDPGAKSPTVLGSLSRGSRQRRAFTVATGDGRVRTLSWQEAALLQGFPEDYLFAAGYMLRREDGRPGHPDPGRPRDPSGDHP